VTLLEFQSKLKHEGAAPAAGTFTVAICGKHIQCDWIDVWLGAFTTDAYPDGAFHVHDLPGVRVVEAEKDG
jgi:hypothetical protein